MKKLQEYVCIYSFGAIVYCLIEVLFRGFTHWTMGLTGGAAFLGIYHINDKRKDEPLVRRCVYGCLLITVLELAVGLLVNRVFHWNVWDYSTKRFNLFGQICPLFSFFWFLLCFPACFLCKGLKKHFCK